MCTRRQATCSPRLPQRQRRPEALCGVTLCARRLCWGGASVRQALHCSHAVGFTLVYTFPMESAVRVHSGSELVRGATTTAATAIAMIRGQSLPCTVLEVFRAKSRPRLLYLSVGAQESRQPHRQAPEREKYRCCKERVDNGDLDVTDRTEWRQQTCWRVGQRWRGGRRRSWRRRWHARRRWRWQWARRCWQRRWRGGWRRGRWRRWRRH